jgi:queuine/archaeosine tRNA-ribosyltransferase
MLLTMHNLRFYQRLTAEIRTAIESRRLATLAAALAADEAQGDIEPR